MESGKSANDSLSFGESLAAATQIIEGALADHNSGPKLVTLGDLVVARRLVDLAELACTRALDSIDDGRSFVDEGCADLGSWLSANTHARQAEALTRRGHNSALKLLPLFSAALHAGRVGVGHLRILAIAVTTEREPIAVDQEAFLVQSASKLSVLQFGQFMRHWAALCDDALNDPKAGDENLLPKRSLTFHELSDGMWRLAGTLDPLSGEIVRAALEAAMPKRADDDARTVPQRRHDALVDLCDESLRNSDRPILGGERPNITVHVDATSGLAHTPQRFFLSSFTRDTILCDATVTSVWLDATKKPFDVGSPTTDIPLRNRKAVVARDQCCRYAGCGRPSRWTEIHHMKHREHGGNNAVENLVALCRFHHRFTHRYGLSLEWADDGLTLIITWPNGKTIHSPPIPQVARIA